MAETTDSIPRRRLAAIVALTAILVAGGIVAMRMSGDRDPIADAIDVLDEESRFDPSRQAVESFVAVYQHLVDEAKTYPKDCDIDEGRGRCLAVNQAASWSLNVATASGACTQPAVQQARIALLGYLRDTVALDAAIDDPPAVPSIPTC